MGFSGHFAKSVFLVTFLPSTSSVATRQRSRHHHLASWRRLFFTEYQVVLGKVFAMRPTKSTQQRSRCRDLFVESRTRQRVCRVFSELYRVPKTIDKAAVFGSV
jgi:hypothetical protein